MYEKNKEGEVTIIIKTNARWSSYSVLRDTIHKPFHIIKDVVELSSAHLTRYFSLTVNLSLSHLIIL